MDTNKEKRIARKRRHRRLRRNLIGNSERPRLAVFRSLKHTYVQIVDDSKGHTIASASDLEPSLRSNRGGKKIDIAMLIGRTIAERARKSGIEDVVFDRGGFKYHGRIKALAEAAREGGLKF